MKTEADGHRGAQVLMITLAVCLGLGAGCGDKSTQRKAPSSSPELDPKAFSDTEFGRIRGGLTGINVGRMIMQRTHPTGTYIASDPPALIQSADRRLIVGKVTVRWAGLSGASYETDFTLEITKERVRLTVERDLAMFKIDPNQLRLAELDLINILRPLQ